jgi:hypothetical protein
LHLDVSFWFLPFNFEEAGITPATTSSNSDRPFNLDTLETLRLHFNCRILYITSPHLVKVFPPIFHIFGHFFTTVGVGLIPARIIPFFVIASEAWQSPVPSEIASAG